MEKKTQLIPMISILLVIGFLLTSFVSFFVSQDSLRKEIVTHALPLTSDNIYTEIQRDLLRPVFISSLMATDTFLRDWILSGEKDIKEIKKYLNEIKVTYNAVTSFFVSEKTRNYYYADGLLKKVSPDSARDIWYFRVSQMEAPYEINVDIDMANNDAMTIFINYRVFDYNQNYIGATGVGLTVTTVKHLIRNYQSKYGRSIYFIDEKGKIKLAGSNIKAAYLNLKELLDDSFFDKTKTISSERAFQHTRDNKNYHANIRYISELGWYLIVEQEASQINRKIATTLILNLFICAVITIIVLKLVHIAIRRYQMKIDTLNGIVPICSFCKQIRDDKGYWNQVEAYLAAHTEAEFSHGICPGCMEKYYPEYSGNNQPDQ